MKFAFFIGSLVGALLLGAVFYSLFGGKSAPAKAATLMMGNVIFRVEIADTQELRARGLSGRDSLDDDAGMFFIFSQPGIYSFWMKDMKFNLDFVWISGDQIVGFTEHATAPIDQHLSHVHDPSQPVDRVLEIGDGAIAAYGLKIGDRVILKQ